MTDEKYIQNQKDFIKRERRIILRDHWTISWGFLLLLALLVLITIIGYQHPNDWQETAITLDRFESVEFHRGSRLDIYDIDGTCYTINRNENSIKDHLSIGQQYTFTYANSFFRKIVMVIKIDDVDYLSYEDSVKYFRDYNAVFWIFNSLVIIGLAVVNIIACGVEIINAERRCHCGTKSKKESTSHAKTGMERSAPLLGCYATDPLWCSWQPVLCADLS